MINNVLNNNKKRNNKNNLNFHSKILNIKQIYFYNNLKSR